MPKGASNPGRGNARDFYPAKWDPKKNIRDNALAMEIPYSLAYWGVKKHNLPYFRPLLHDGHMPGEMTSLFVGEGPD